MENKKLPKLDLNVTNMCNFRCTHCAFDSGIREMPELTLSEIEKILIETKEIGGQKFDITGGEPLLRKDVGEIIIMGKRLGYKIELVTNGSLLTKAKLEEFKHSGLDGIAISLDGSTPEAYNRIRKRDEKTFCNVIKNIIASKKAGFYTKINTTVFACNLKNIPGIIELALGLGVDEVGLYYFTPIGRGDRSRERAVEPITWLNFIQEKLKKYRDIGLRISLEFPLIEREYWNSNLGCIANQEKSHLQILPDGNVYPCAILASYGKPLANLKTTAIKEIWNNSQLWERYWASLSSLFENCNGGCVNFKQAFDISKYDSNRHCFVCPLRKFELGVIR